MQYPATLQVITTTFVAAEVYERLGSPDCLADLADAVDEFVSKGGELNKRERLELLRYARKLPEFRRLAFLEI